MTIEEYFHAGGSLSRGLPGFQYRDQQLRMAQAVADSLRSGTTLLCEAGTGTGKTLAYLLPALASGRSLILSTGTRNLQEQLFYKDLPLAIEALGRHLDCALLKGRSNYLCLQRLESFSTHGRFDNPRIPADLSRIQDWAARTGSGDIAELAEIPEAAQAWRYATSNRDNCLGSACGHYQDCHLMAARQKALDAEVVVVNHHLLLGHLALGEAGHGELLPAAEILVIDEAHQLPAIATEFFGLHLGSGQLLELCRDVDLARRTEAQDAADLSEMADATARQVSEFRLAFGAQSARLSWSEAQRLTGLSGRIEALLDQLTTLRDSLALVAGRGRCLAACADRAREQAAQLEQLSQAVPEDHLSWLDINRRGFTWHLSPLQVGSQLGESFRRNFASLILTSATLAVAGRLEHFSHQSGLPTARQEVFDSPFDFSRQSLLYLPRDLPDPGSSEFHPRIFAEMLPVLQASQGRAFILFTSHGALQRGKTYFQEHLPFALFAQGDAPRGELLEGFRASGDGVLLATYSFWQGVDVRGAALSCVIIDKLPFAPPDDPLLKARHAQLRAAGENPFMVQQLPHAAILLKQGVGRLIRDTQDRGVVMICDPRLETRRYGRILLDSLPPMPLTHRLAQVEEFFCESIPAQ